MKRLIASLLALAVVAFPAGPAGAELLKNFRLSGQIDIQSTNSKNISDFATAPNPNTKYPPAAGVPAAGGGWSNGVPCIGAGCTGVSNRDRMNDVQTRIMLHLDWDLLDDVHSRITLRKNDRAWGTTGNNPVTEAGGTNSQPIGVTGNTSVIGNIFVDEAFFKVDKIAGQFDTTFGRQFFGDANDLVIHYGPSEKAWYGLPVSAIDAARLDWGGAETITMTALAGTTKNTGVGTLAPADTNVFGADFTGKSGDAAKGSIYIWNKVTHNNAAEGVAPTQGPGPAAGPNPGFSAGGKNDFLYVVGAKFKLAGGGFWLKGEYDQDFGDNRTKTDTSGNNAAARHYIGYAMMGTLGFKAEDENTGMFSIWGEAALGSGQSNTHENRNDGWVPINGDYRPGSIYGRFAANGAFAGLGSGVANPFPTNTSITDSGLSNRVIWGTGIKLSPAVANKFQLAVSWWDFRIHRFADFPSYAPSPAGTAGNAGPGYAYGGNSHIGSELDVDVTWQHSENVSFGAGWATFQPGGAIYNAVRTANLAANGNFLGQNLGGDPGGLAGATQGVNPAMLVYCDVRIKF